MQMHAHRGCGDRQRCAACCVATRNAPPLHWFRSRTALETDGRRSLVVTCLRRHACRTCNAVGLGARGDVPFEERGGSCIWSAACLHPGLAVQHCQTHVLTQRASLLGRSIVATGVNRVRDDKALVLAGIPGRSDRLFLLLHSPSLRMLMFAGLHCVTHAHWSHKHAPLHAASTWHPGTAPRSPTCHARTLQPQRHRALAALRAARRLESVCLRGTTPTHVRPLRQEQKASR